MEEVAPFDETVEHSDVTQIVQPIEPTMEKLLQEWGFSCLIEEFQQKGIDIEVLKELNSDDLNRLISDQQFGLRVKFRKVLYQWQLKKGCRSTAATTTVDSWLSSLPVTYISESSELLTKESGQSSPTPCTSSSSNNNENITSLFDLEKQLVLNSATGALILANYKKTHRLTKSDRQYIVQVAAEYLISKNRRITNFEYKEISQKIVELFPTEDEVTYFGTNNQRGKLAEKYYTLSKKYVKSGIIERPVKRKLSEKTTVLVKQLIYNLEDQQNNFFWLQKNFSPEVLVTEKWISTYELRRSHIQDVSIDILSQWPILKQKIGVSLIELDFERLFPQKSTLLFSKWDSFYQTIIQIFDRDIKDSYCRRLFDSMNSISNQDSKNYITTILLNGILIPPVIKGHGLQKPWKPSILDAQKSFATYLLDKSYIQSTIELRKTQCKERYLRLQPSIIVIGDNLENITQFYIHFNDILYEVDNYLNAICINFQLHYVLGLQYSMECIQVWQLIEEYFYEMDSTKKRNSSLNALLNDLSNQNNG